MHEGRGTRYQFRVRGPLSENAAQLFPELDAVMLGQQTLFYGTVIDDAYLFGLLHRFRVQGLLILEMRCPPDHPCGN
ncbi:hypothetical protein ACGFX8_36285 [Streptomyces sp. NPDC048362]|uniref:hypothetical protein n=1 Tax=Streptomyces sp. NPDC048362 TaxID=3365539 RepID=UPI003714FD2A